MCSLRSRRPDLFKLTTPYCISPERVSWLAVSAMRAATSSQAQTRRGSPASDPNRLDDADTTDSPSGRGAPSRELLDVALRRKIRQAQQQPLSLHEPAAIPIDPVVLRDEFPLESNQPYQDIQHSDTIWLSQQELPCLSRVPRSIFDDDHIPLGLINESRPATHHSCGEHPPQTHLGNIAEGCGSSPQYPRQQHCSSDINRAGQRKRPSTVSDERKRRRTSDKE